MAAQSRGTGRVLFVEVFKAAVIAGLTLMAIRQGWVPTGNPSASAAETSTGSSSEVVALDPFVVNVGTGTDSAAYLRVALAMTVKNPRHADTLKSDAAVRARLRAALLEQLGGQAVPLLVTAEGRATLAKQLEGRAKAVVPGVPLEMLITDFVVEY